MTLAAISKCPDTYSLSLKVFKGPRDIQEALAA